MKSITKILLVLGICGILVLVSGCTKSDTTHFCYEGDTREFCLIPTFTPTVTPTPVPMTDEDTVRTGVIGFFKSSAYSFPGENETLSGIALQNAISGTHSLKVIGETPEEALDVFRLYEWDCGGVNCFYMPKDLFNLEWKNNAYGIGVYKTGNQYNISIVYPYSVPDSTEVTDSGAYQLVKHQDKIEYLW